MRTAIVLQARMGSTRLSGKALLPLGGRSLVDQAMARLNLVPADARVLATDAASESALRPAAERNGFELVVGPAEDVLARYCIAARSLGADLVLRATGDNPLVSYELAALLLERRASVPSDYAAHTGMPTGLGVELVSAQALFKAESEARLPSEREHVCPYLYGHPELFSIDRSEAPGDYLAPGLRATVDTSEDYEAVLRVYGALYDGDPIPTKAATAYPASRSGAAKEG